MAVSYPQSIRISGIGGQGNVLMGIILADALVSKRYWVVQTQSHGAQVRGGLSYCDVLFCKEPIDYPEASSFDVIYSMHQFALNMHAILLKTNGILIVDNSYIDRMPKEAFRATKKIIIQPVTKIVEEKLGSSLPANMAGLGMIAKAANLLQSDELKKAMKKYIKPKYHELNEKAIDLGFSLIERSYVLKEERHDFVGRGFE